MISLPQVHGLLDHGEIIRAPVPGGVHGGGERCPLLMPDKLLQGLPTRGDNAQWEGESAVQYEQNTRRMKRNPDEDKTTCKNKPDEKEKNAV